MFSGFCMPYLWMKLWTLWRYAIFYELHEVGLSSVYNAHQFIIYFLNGLLDRLIFWIFSIFRILWQVLPNRMAPMNIMWKGGAVSISRRYNFLALPLWLQPGRHILWPEELVVFFLNVLSPASELVLYDQNDEMICSCLLMHSWCWWSGQVLAVLDFGRDSWVQFEDWLDGMVMVGSGRKYRDSNTLQAQAFWYNAMLD